MRRRRSSLRVAKMFVFTAQPNPKALVPKIYHSAYLIMPTRRERGFACTSRMRSSSFAERRLATAAQDGNRHRRRVMWRMRELPTTGVSSGMAGRHVIKLIRLQTLCHLCHLGKHFGEHAILLMARLHKWKTLAPTHYASISPTVRVLRDLPRPPSSSPSALSTPPN